MVSILYQGGYKMIKMLLRLPDDLHASLVAWAKREDRSLHSLIVHLLRNAVKEQGDAI